MKTPRARIFEVSLQQSGYYTLLSSTLEPFALLDCSTIAILESLTSCGFASLRYQAVCTDYPPYVTSRFGTREEKNEEFTLQLNIYGLRSYMDNLGTVLRVLKSYLQQPFYVDDGVEYDNPHYFKLVGQKTPWVERRETQGRDIGSKDESPFSQALTNVFESQLTHADSLRELEAAPIIKTALLRYLTHSIAILQSPPANGTEISDIKGKDLILSVKGKPVSHWMVSLYGKD